MLRLPILQGSVLEALVPVLKDLIRSFQGLENRCFQIELSIPSRSAVNNSTGTSAPTTSWGVWNMHARTVT
jgi:hypothetical protein